MIDLSQKFDKKWDVEHWYGYQSVWLSIFQKMELRLSYFDATNVSSGNDAKRKIQTENTDNVKKRAEVNARRTRSIFYSICSQVVWHGTSGFHSNTGFKVKFTTRFQNMYHSKSKKPLDQIINKNASRHYRVLHFLARDLLLARWVFTFFLY